MKANFLKWACEATGIEDAAMVEKDFCLHSLLSRIAENETLRSKLLFKGGTCLVKSYLPYYRFSDDIDFGWQDGSLWRGRAPGRSRRTAWSRSKGSSKSCPPSPIPWHGL